MILQIILLIIVSLVVLTRENKNLKVKGPPTQFLLGNLNLYFQNIGKSHKLQRELHSKYGPFVRTYIGSRLVVHINDFDVAKAVLEKRNYPKPEFMYAPVRPILGNGLVTATGDTWKRHRIALNPVGSPKKIKGMIGSMNESISKMLQVIKKSVDSQESVELDELMNRCALDIIGKIAFGLEFEALSYERGKTGDVIIENLKESMKFMEKKMFLPFLNYFPDRMFPKFNKNVKTLRNIANEAISKRKDDIKQGKQIPEDILNLLMSPSGKEQEILSTQEIEDEVMTFLAAGYEITSHSTTWTLLDLLRNEDSMKKVIQEIDSVIGNDEIITCEHVGKLDYLHCCFNESLRLWSPTGSGHFRELNENTSTLIEGVDLKKGTLLWVSSHAIHMNEQYWSNPTEYNPSRWENVIEKEKAFMPFSLGSRTCIGKSMAYIEVKLIISSILRKFKLSLLPNQEIIDLVQITVRPSPGVFFTATER